MPLERETMKKVNLKIVLDHAANGSMTPEVKAKIKACLKDEKAFCKELADQVDKPTPTSLVTKIASLFRGENE